MKSAVILNAILNLAKCNVQCVDQNKWSHHQTNDMDK